MWVEITSYGVQAHGSTPELGKNAIVPLAQLISSLPSLDLGDDFDKAFDGWTMNIGTIHGGFSTNMVPASARVTIDFRIPKGISHDSVVAAIQAKADAVKSTNSDASFKIAILHETEPHLTDKTSVVIQAFDRAAKKLAIPMDYGTFGGNTVAKNLYFAGITSVVHYPGDDKLAHVPNEFVKIDELMLGTVLYAETLEEYFR